ncbi:MAG TPA: hypothetical protein VIH77_02900 [Steroidobacteraceae bacterium]
MRVVFVVIAALIAGTAAVAAEPDSAGPQKSAAAARHPKAKSAPTLASPITDHFALRGTFFAAALNTDLHLDSSVTVPGTLVNAEHDLGMKGRLNQGRMELIFRLHERHRLRVDYFGSDRDGDRPVGKEIFFGGHTFMSGDVVQSDLQYSMLGFTYTYSLIRTERFELGAGLGVHLLQADARGTDVTLQQNAESSGVGAFPTPALDGTWAISQRFAWTARAQYLSATVHGISGALGDYHTDLQYRWTPNFEIGLGYEEIRAQLSVQRSSTTPGGFALSIRGPELFLRASF